MFPTGVIRVICVSEKPLFQFAVECQFKDVKDIELRAYGTSLSEFKPLALQHRPCVALLKIHYPLARQYTSPESLPFDQALQRISQDTAGVEILIVASRLEPALIGDLDSLRIRGYLLTHDPRTLRLPEAVRVLALGGTIYSDAVLRARQRLPDGGDGNGILTLRQLEILNAILAEPNHSYVQHAERLGITDSTFDSHLYNIYRKLEVNTLTAAVIRALQLGLLPLPPLPAPSSLVPENPTREQTNH